MADLKAFLCGELPNHENMLQNEQLRDLLERRGIVEDPDIPNAKARLAEQELRRNMYHNTQTSVYKGYKRDKIEMRGDRAEISDFPLYLNTVAGGLDCRDQTIGGFSFVVKIYAVPVVEIIG